MRLYHGTDRRFRLPKLEKCNKYTDFGRGFYLTHELERAKEWGANKNSLKYRINIYEVADNYIQEAEQLGLNILQFPKANAEWAEFVYKNRNDETFSHNFDIVIGPVADNALQLQFARMWRECLSFKDIASKIQYHKFKKPQICFCSERSLNLLNYTKAICEPHK